MRWRNRLEVAIYRKIKPFTEEREQRALSGDVQAIVPELRPWRAILRSKVAAVAVTAALAGGGGVLLGGFIEDQSHDAQLASMDAAEEEQMREDAEWRANHDVCLAKAEARAEPEDGMFAAITDPQLDKCYTEQRLQVAEIKAGRED